MQVDLAHLEIIEPLLDMLMNVSQDQETTPILTLLMEIALVI